ncbi:MAG: mechanosensitive ion channel [Woeseiaceae bacterium]|nr:mechanosensitive ion channel [Woeseiaceae bacterium]
MNETTIAGFSFDWQAMYDKFQALGIDFGIMLVTALVIFFVGRLVARIVARAIRKVMQARQVDRILESFVSNFVYWMLMAFVIIAAITQIGIATTSFIAVLGAAGLAIGLAMQGSLSNFAAGVLIVMFRPYRVGDWVEVAGVSGSVESVQIFTTTLKTADNKTIIVPNSSITSNIITNYSANDTRRVDMVVGVSYSDDLDKVRNALRETVAADERVLADPPCVIAVAQLADSSVNFNVRPWVKTGDYWGVMWDLTENIKKRFDKDGISIPFPQQDVYVHKSE